MSSVYLMNQNSRDPVLLYVTFPTLDGAKAAAKILLEEKLIACANLLPQMLSIYFWQEEVKEEQEVVLLLKTRNDLSLKVTQRVVALHTYDCPAVLQIPIEGGHSEFLRWIQEETKEGGIDESNPDDTK